MKKILIGLFVILITVGIYFLEFGYRVNAEPVQYFKVYLDGEILGVVHSKQELEDYIDKQNDEYRREFGVNKVYSPNGLDIEKILSYDDKVDSIKDIYERILSKKPFTINGYQFTINSIVREEHKDSKTSEKMKTTRVYVTEQDIFKESIDNVITTFVGKEKYKDYQEKTQSQITSTGSYIDSIYLEDSITIKRVKIPVTEKVYTTSDELTKYLLFGTTKDQKNIR